MLETDFLLDQHPTYLPLFLKKIFDHSALSTQMTDGESDD